MSMTGGGVPPLNVRIVISTSGAGQAANSIRQVNQAVGGMNRGLGAGVISTRTLGDAMRMSATLMKYTVAGAFVRIGTAAIQASRNFELSFSRIRGLVGMGADAVESMKKGVLEMATETTRGPEELAEALYFITSAGLRDASVALDVLRVSAKAAAAGMGDTNDVADAVTSAMNAYGQEMLSAGKATDIMVAAVREGKAEADTFAPAFSKVLPVAAAFGASFEDVAASMAALTRTGMTAGTAGIYMRQVLSQLLKPSKQAREALASVGTSAEQIRTEVQEKGLFVALQNLSNQLGGIENAQDFARVFGNVRALTAVLQLVGPAAEANAEIFERLGNSTGDLGDAFAAYEDTTDAAFQRARASAQTSLIALGEGIKPVVTSLLELSTVVTSVFKAIVDNPFGKFLTTVGTGMVLAVVALASVMKTSSAVIRLFSNMSITLAGTQYQYNATTGAVYKYTLATRQAAAANTHATLTANGWSRANGILAGTIRATTVAMQLFSKALLWITVILTVIEAIKWFRGKKEDTDSLAESVGKLNEVLDETVKYGKINLTFGVTGQVQKAKLDQDVERLRKQIEDQSPQLISNLKEQLVRLQEMYGTMGRQSGIAYVRALMDSVFGGVTGETRKVLEALFLTDLGIGQDEWASALVPTTTGDAVTDAIVYQAVGAARLASKTAAEQIKGDTFKDYVDAVANNMTTVTDAWGNTTKVIDKDMDSANQAFAKSFVDVINETGNIAPFIYMLKELSENGVLVADTMDDFIGAALKGLEGDFELAGESAGNWADIIMDPKNGRALADMFVKSGFVKTSGEAVSLLLDMREAMKGLPPGILGSEEAMRIFSGFVSDYYDVSEDAVDITDEHAKKMEALAEATRSAVEEFEAQTSTMKELEKVQRGLMGIALTQEEALRDVKGQYQEFGESVQKAGGSFSFDTENGLDARAQLQAAAEGVLAYANAIAVAEGDAAGAKAFATGIADILSIAEQAGGTKAGIDAAAVLQDMGITGENFAASLAAVGESTEAPSQTLGQDVANGIAAGITAGTQTMSDALVTALKNVLVVGANYAEIESPSKLTARMLGKPMAEGVEVGFTKYATSNKFNNGISKALDNAINKAYKKGGRTGLSKYLTDFLDKKSNVETPAQDFVKATIDRMKDIIGSLGNYINSQLNFRKAQAELAKLVNMQRGLEDRQRRAARESQYSQTRFGRAGGAEVTAYEQSQLDQLQLEFERLSRDYAMGRATYTDLVDAEIALYEARAAATETNDDVLNAENDFIDATVDLENRNLDLAAATVEVLASYQDVQEAAAELYMNHKELAQVYDALAEATGIASGKLQVGNTDLTNLGNKVNALGGFSSTVGGYVSILGNNLDITGNKFRSQFDGPNGIFSKISATGANVKTLTDSIGVRFTDLSKGLLDPDAPFTKDLKSLGPAIFKAIRVGAQESLDKSPLTLRISLDAQMDSSGNGTIRYTSNLGQKPPPATPPPRPAGPYIPGVGGIAENPILYSPYGEKAVGGPVSAMNPYLVGERGPEMFVPKVSGTIVTTSALERYSRSRANSGRREAGTNNTISVVVNNPVPEPASDSITRRMKVLSNSGLFG